MTADSTQQAWEASAIEFLMPSGAPCGGLAGVGRIEEFSKIAEVFFNVKTVHDLDGIGKQFLGNVPNPESAVADYSRALGLGEASTRGLAR